MPPQEDLSSFLLKQFSNPLMINPNPQPMISYIPTSLLSEIFQFRFHNTCFPQCLHHTLDTPIFKVRKILVPDLWNRYQHRFLARFTYQAVNDLHEESTPDASKMRFFGPGKCKGQISVKEDYFRCHFSFKFAF